MHYRNTHIYIEYAKLTLGTQLLGSIGGRITGRIRHYITRLLSEACTTFPNDKAYNTRIPPHK